MSATVPLQGFQPFATRAVVSESPFAAGTVYGSAEGTAGSPMSVTYRLNVR